LWEPVITLANAQRIIIERNISNTRLDQLIYTVNFSSKDFKNYTYQALSDGEILAEIVNGNAESPSTLNSSI